MMIAMNRLTKIWETRIWKTMKKVYEAIGEPHAYESPPFSFMLAYVSPSLH